MNLVETVHTPEVTARHAIREWMIETCQDNIHTDRATQRTILGAAINSSIDDTSPMKLAMLDNEIALGE